jgi:predicted metal-dependent hydrolase
MKEDIRPSEVNMKVLPNAYVSYLVEFHASRDFFECHELLEEYWKDHPKDPLTETWLGLIQLAVGLYHDRRGNKRGAIKMLMQAERKLAASPLKELGIDKDRLLEQLLPRLSEMQSGTESVYVDIDLRITSAELLARCQQLCKERNLIWGKPSSLVDESIIHRHLRRDRSEVIAARLQAYEAKKRERNGL